MKRIGGGILYLEGGWDMGDILEGGWGGWVRVGENEDGGLF